MHYFILSLFSYWTVDFIELLKLYILGELALYDVCCKYFPPFVALLLTPSLFFRKESFYSL